MTIQKIVAARIADTSEAKRVYRFDINQGDVPIDGNDILGQACAGEIVHATELFTLVVRTIQIYFRRRLRRDVRTLSRKRC